MKYLLNRAICQFNFSAKIKEINKDLKYDLTEQEAGFMIVGHLECDITVSLVYFQVRLVSIKHRFQAWREKIFISL